MNPYLEGKRRVRRALRRLGVDLTRTASRPFGEDVWLDVQRLASAWNAPIATIFDVGANVGETALALRSRFPAARILAFEPHPETCRRLRANVGGHGVETFDFALGDASRSAELFEYRFSTLNSLVENAPYAVRFGETARTRPVTVRTLDEFCREAEIDRIDVLKVDTEGGDLDVLRGGGALLHEGRVRFVQVEFNDVFEDARAHGGALLPIAELLHSCGLRLLASYTEQVFPDDGLFVVATALFARPQS